MASLAEQQPEFEFTENRAHSIRYLEHGYPNPLVRWHHHDDYELHYIVGTTGKCFVGDYIGEFQAGQLVLTGPRLPHNWISHMQTGDSVPLRDMLVQFNKLMIKNMAQVAPELDELLPMLDRARYGIEFGGEAQHCAVNYLSRIRDANGAAKVSILLELLQLCAQEQQYKLLSDSSMRSYTDDDMMKKVDVVANYVTDRFHTSINLATAAELVGMSESAFSRFFTKATGNGFNDFLNRVRVSKACELLAHTDKPITTICFEVGFNNVANFNRRFRSIKNTTPRDYRDQAKLRVGSAQ